MAPVVIWVLPAMATAQSPVVTSNSPVAGVFSPKPIRRVSFEEMGRLADLLEEAGAAGATAADTLPSPPPSPGKDTGDKAAFDETTDEKQEIASSGSSSSSSTPNSSRESMAITQIINGIYGTANSNEPVKTFPPSSTTTTSATTTPENDSATKNILLYTPKSTAIKTATTTIQISTTIITQIINHYSTPTSSSTGRAYSRSTSSDTIVPNTITGALPAFPTVPTRTRIITPAYSNRAAALMDITNFRNLRNRGPPLFASESATGKNTEAITVGRTIANQHLSDLLFGSVPYYGNGSRHGVIGGERAGKKVGAIGVERAEWVRGGRFGVFELRG